MPIYEYECVSCEHQFETIQRISEDPLLDCPECGKPDLKKLVSVAAFRLKGAGWYETDFKSGEKKNIAGKKRKADQISRRSGFRQIQLGGRCCEGGWAERDRKIG
ncbi:MAG: hypothetical protein CM1200mP9_10320 [Gammaproteobacteria bacterium]|nr:MAG: hypothetical protein CM1200mP9_10320 [Gammaproteobacteria bacterium]